jgi:hypothetical protein
LLQCSNCQSLRAELSCSLKATFLQHNWPSFFKVILHTLKWA